MGLIHRPISKTSEMCRRLRRKCYDSYNFFCCLSGIFLIKWLLSNMVIHVPLISICRPSSTSTHTLDVSKLLFFLFYLCLKTRFSHSLTDEIYNIPVYQFASNYWHLISWPGLLVPFLILSLRQYCRYNRNIFLLYNVHGISVLLLGSGYLTGVCFLYRSSRFFSKH